MMKKAPPKATPTTRQESDESESEGESSDDDSDESEEDVGGIPKAKLAGRTKVMKRNSGGLKALFR
jgi:hypothetical protein